MAAPAPVTVEISPVTGAGAAMACPSTVGYSAGHVAGPLRTPAVPVQFDPGDRVAGGEGVPVAGVRVRGQTQIGQRPVVAVAGEEPVEAGCVVPEPHVVVPGARIDPHSVEPVRR